MSVNQNGATAEDDADQDVDAEALANDATLIQRESPAVSTGRSPSNSPARREMHGIMSTSG